MPDDRAQQAMARIERALGRIEAAAGERLQSSNGELRRLREAHQALRGKVEQAVAELDQLLASEGAQ